MPPVTKRIGRMAGAEINVARQRPSRGQIAAHGCLVGNYIVGGDEDLSIRERLERRGVGLVGFVARRSPGRLQRLGRGRRRRNSRAGLAGGSSNKRSITG